jgi:hypothetical protein
MMGARPLVRLRQLGGEQRRLLLKATGLLAVVSAAVALLPFRIAIRFGCGALGATGSTAIDDVVWAVEAAARRMPSRSVCIEKGLVGQRMLRSAGIDAILHYGARQLADGGRLEAHVWVTVGGHTVIGGAEAASFAELAAYP